MRILHILKITRMAGVERHLLTLCQGLRERDIDARILFLVEPKHPMPEYAAACARLGIPHRHLRIHHDADLSLPWRLARVIRQEGADIAHLHLIHAEIHGNLAARWSKVPHILVSRHNQDAFRESLPLRAVLPWLWRRVDGAIIIAEHLRQTLEKQEGVDPRKIRCIHYGLEKQRSNTPPELRAELSLATDTLLVGVVSRLVAQKGLLVALDAFAQGAPNTAHLLIIGDGPQRAELEARLKQLTCRERVHFLGWRQDAASALATMDVLLMPSHWEGFGRVLLEAFAAWLPILASRVGGIVEVVEDGVSGLLCPAGDVVAFSQALTRLCNDKELRKQLAAAGHSRLIARFSAATMVDETLSFYQEFIKGKR